MATEQNGQSIIDVVANEYKSMSFHRLCDEARKHRGRWQIRTIHRGDTTFEVNVLLSLSGWIRLRVSVELTLFADTDPIGSRMAVRYFEVLESGAIHEPQLSGSLAAVCKALLLVLLFAIAVVAAVAW